MANLEQLALDIRRDSIESIYRAGSGHPGGCLSCADILAYLFGKELKGAPLDPNRDRFILSKGHAAPALYSALQRTGRIDYDNNQLRELGSKLQGHPSVTHIPEVETSTGSLGQGFSVGVGMALGLKLRGSTARVFVLLGDGELQEGIVHEAATFARHHKLDNLIAIIDFNGFQSDDRIENISDIVPDNVGDIFQWSDYPIEGNDMDEIVAFFDDFGWANWHSGPTLLIALTTKGKGVSFMEGPYYHGSLTLTKDEYERAMEELDG